MTLAVVNGLKLELVNGLKWNYVIRIMHKSEQ